MYGEEFTPGKYTAKAHAALHGEKKKGLGILDVLALTLSFAAGILIVTGMLNVVNESSGVQVARAVGEPSDVVVATDVDVEVAGVVCEVAALSNEDSSIEALELWNDSVVSTGDECSAPFADSLGPAWLMTDAELSVFGPVGSVYEFVNTGGILSGFRISLAPEDAAANELNDLAMLIDTVWGAETIDWTNGCEASASTWSGTISPADTIIELSRCR